MPRKSRLDSPGYGKIVMKKMLLLIVTLFYIVLVYNQDSIAQSPSIIEKIQNDIAKADSPQTYYIKEYAPVETRYWSKISGWMVEDMIDRNYIQKKPAISILDIGCGYGTLLSYASEVYGANGTCLDVVPYLKSSVMKKYGLSFVSGNIEKDSLPSGKLYDIIIMTEVLEHLNFQPVPTLKKIHASLKKDGVFFLSTPDADSWGKTTKYYKSLRDIPPVDPEAPWIDDHIWQYNKSEIKKVLHAAGFKILRLERSEAVTGYHFNIWAVDKNYKENKITP